MAVTMTGNLTILLAQIDVLRAQHKAGIVPPFGALDDLFDYAGLVKLDLASLAGVFDPATAGPAAAPAATPLRLDALDESIAVHVDVPIGRVARALLVALGRADADPVTLIGGARRG